MRLERAARAARETCARLPEERLVRVARVPDARQIDDWIGEEVHVEQEHYDGVDDVKVPRVLAPSLHVDDDDADKREGQPTEEAGDKEKGDGDEGLLLHADVERLWVGRAPRVSSAQLQCSDFLVNEHVEDNVDDGRRGEHDHPHLHTGNMYSDNVQ